jgi:hypothetical protein
LRERAIARTAFDAPAGPSTAQLQREEQFKLSDKAPYPSVDELAMIQEDTRTVLESRIPLRTLRELGGKLDGRAKDMWEKHMAALERKIALYSAVRTGTPLF